MRPKLQLSGILSFLLLFCLTSCVFQLDCSANITITPSVELKTTQDLLSIQDAPADKNLSQKTAPVPTATSTNTSTPTPQLPCSPEFCVYPGHFLLARPIQPPANDQIDSTYRYGSTQEGARPTHHGVEFVNEEGTPVLAAADGRVIVAGTDSQQAYANFPFYYGNLVIIEHQFPSIEKAVFTLYGHLSSVQVQQNDLVEAGDQVGAVGYTGIAEWSHLHFEVRLGQNLFRSTRNPELWLFPHQNDSGDLNGTLAGRIVDEYGSPIYIPGVVIERLTLDGSIAETIYVETYADFTVNGDDLWGENFAIGDLTPGKYRISFIARGLQEREVEVYPGRLTVFVFDASQQ